MKEFFGLRAKTYSYLKDNNDEDKKENLNLKIIKTAWKQLRRQERKLKFEDY